MNRIITRFKLRLLVKLLDWYFDRSCESHSNSCEFNCRFQTEEGCKITSLMKNIASDYDEESEI